MLPRAGRVSGVRVAGRCADAGRASQSPAGALRRSGDRRHHYFIASANDAPVRFDAAYAVVVQRSARVAAEDLQFAAARVANPNGAPVVVHYRVLNASGWTGRVAGASLESAATQARRIQDVAVRQGRAVQATSVAQGCTTLAASRVPQLAFLADRPLVPSVAPTLDL